MKSEDNTKLWDCIQSSNSITAVMNFRLSSYEYMFSPDLLVSSSALQKHIKPKPSRWNRERSCICRTGLQGGELQFEIHSSWCRAVIDWWIFHLMHSAAETWTVALLGCSPGAWANFIVAPGWGTQSSEGQERRRGTGNVWCGGGRRGKGYITFNCLLV